MAWTIDYREKTLKQLRKIDKVDQMRILDGMKEVATLDDPRLRGKGLTGVLSGFWRYRFGDYRVLCRIVDHRMLIIAVKVGHRSAIYERQKELLDF